MASRYAESTTVTEERSKQEIERTLRRYGADKFAYGWEPGSAGIEFRLRGRVIRLTVPMPCATDRKVTHTPMGNRRSSATEIQKALEQEERRRWRVLLVLLKGALEAVECGIVTLEDVFLAGTVLPSGETVSEVLQAQVTAAYERGTAVLLPAPGGQR